MLHLPNILLIEQTVFETRSHTYPKLAKNSLAKDDLELLIILHVLTECWDPRPVTPSLASFTVSLLQDWMVPCMNSGITSGLENPIY